MASGAMPRPHETATQFGKYTLLAKLASGGMGELYLAQLRAAGGFEKLVVIKRILPHLTDQKEFVEMFVDEARTAARISHPNVCQIYELGQIDGRYYMALEYLEGVSLSDVMVARTRSPQLADLRLIASLIAQAAEGLHHAHCLRSPDGSSAQLVHRDINPRNIFVTSAGVAKVLDFGIVKVRGALSQTSTGSIKGTYSYMAPEQLQGEDLDCRADIFSLGTILWEAVVGRRLFKRQSDMLTWQAICEDPIPRPSRYRPDLPSDLDAVTMRALARERDQRYASARELALDLERAIKPLGAPLTTLAISAEIESAFDSRLGEQRERVFAAHRQQEAEKAGLASTIPDDWGEDDDRDTRVADPNYAVFASTAQPRPRRVASEMPLNTPSEIHTIDEAPGEPGSVVGRSPLRKPKNKPLGQSTQRFVDEVPPGFDDVWPEPISSETGQSSSKQRRRRPAQSRHRSSVSSASARSRSPWPMVLALMVFGAGAAAFAYVLKKDHLDQPSAPSAATPTEAPAMTGTPAETPQPAASAPEPGAATDDGDSEAEPEDDSAQAATSEDDDAPALSGAIPPSAAEPDTSRRESKKRPSRAERSRERARQRDKQRERRQAEKRDKERERRQAEQQAKAAAATNKPANRSVGYLTINAKPYAMVYVDGRKKSYTPVVRLELPPGSHTVKLVPSNKAEDKKFKVQIRAGKEERKFIKW